MNGIPIKHFVDDHSLALCLLGFFIFVIVSISYLVFIVFIDDPIEYTVTVDETIQLKKRIVIGVIDSVRIQDNGLTKIRLNEGFGVLGFDNLETYWIATDLQLLPSDVVKVTITTYEGIGCTYSSSDGIVHEYPARQVNIKLYGDLCGKYWDYEVEKI